MIQPVKKLHICSLTVKGFKGFAESHTFTFSDMNTITGHNGQGKTSIADAIAFAIVGVPFFGGARLDHLYHQETWDISVELEFVDESGAVRRLARRRVRDSMEIILDGRPATQRDLTLMFGERDLFLSIFNPRYFIDVMGAKGRDLLERYLPEIPHDQIMAALSEYNQDVLRQQQFLSAEAFVKKLREEIAQLNRDMIYAQGQKDLQQAQAEDSSRQLSDKRELYQRLKQEADTLEARRTVGFDGASMTDRLTDLYVRHDELLREQPAGPGLTAELDDQIRAAAQSLEQVRARVYQSKFAQALSDTQARIDALGKEVSRQKHIVVGLKPGVQCPMCRQTVTEATLPQVRDEFKASINGLCRQGREQTGQLAELKELDAKALAKFEEFKQTDTEKAEAALAELTSRRANLVENAQRDNTQHRQEIDRLHAEIQSIELDLEYGRLVQDEYERLCTIKGQLVTLEAEIGILNEQASSPSLTTLDMEQLEAEKKEKETILAALGVYIAKRVELSLAQLKMNRVDISLYDVVKSTGELRDVFKFTYEARPYVCLSGSERIRAGLEVAELVKKLVGVDYPVFIDDAERVPVIDNVRPSGQIFVAKVIKGAKLSVQAAGAAPAAQAA